MTQVCVWESTLVGESNIQDFEELFLKEYKVRIKYIEEIKTFPDTDQNGFGIEGTGGRSDVFFSIHKDDISKFATTRFSFDPPIRWIEDVLQNLKNPIYPERVQEYKTWNEEIDEA